MCTTTSINLDCHLNMIALIEAPMSISTTTRSNGGDDWN